MILTNGEIYTSYIEAANQTLRPQDERIALAFARAIEAAVIAKLSQGVSVVGLTKLLGRTVSLFQCEVCGCCENTALACQGCDGYTATFFDWAGFEDRKGKKLCSACAPTKYRDGRPSELGKWHGEFPRRYLPMGMFKTAQNGNLEHKETGEQDIAPYVLPNAVAQREP